MKTAYMFLRLAILLASGVLCTGAVCAEKLSYPDLLSREGDVEVLAASRTA